MKQTLVLICTAALLLSLLSLACSYDLPEGIFGCASDSDCPRNWHCRTSDNLSDGLRCFSKAETECYAYTDCLNNQVCDRGECIELDSGQGTDGLLASTNRKNGIVTVRDSFAARPDSASSGEGFTQQESDSGGDEDRSAVCGSNIIDQGEVCDGNDLGGQTCGTLTSDVYIGELKCSEDCGSFDMTSCYRDNIGGSDGDLLVSVSPPSADLSVDPDKPDILGIETGLICEIENDAYDSLELTYDWSLVSKPLGGEVEIESPPLG